eukprot:5239142-Pyramimonas_sp.AAC.1
MNKGHAGTNPCSIGRSIVNQKLDYSLYDPTGLYVSDAFIDTSKWVTSTDETVVAILRRSRPTGNEWRMARYRMNDSGCSRSFAGGTIIQII